MAAGLAVPQGQTKDGLVGRDAEVAEIGAFLTATAGAPSALVVVGDVGIGKTAVWKHTVQAASGTYRVLSCRPARAEAPLAFSALDDLLGGVLAEILPGLPEPRRRALEAALHGSPAAPFTLSLDQPAVSILLTLRGEDPVFPLGLEQALSPASLACAQLGGLSPVAIGAILRARLGVTFPRSTFRRLYEACGGNPLYALESGRALLERGRACTAGEPIPI